MNKIEIGKVYVSNDGGFYKTPIAVKGDVVAYWWTSSVYCIGGEANASCTSVKSFLDDNKLYNNPMTFKRIKDEGIKDLISEREIKREVIGFSRNGFLVTRRDESEELADWTEDQIKDWEAV